MTKYCTRWIKIPFTKWKMRKCHNTCDTLELERSGMARPIIDTHIGIAVSDATGGIPVRSYSETLITRDVDAVRNEITGSVYEDCAPTRTMMTCTMHIRDYGV